MRPSRALGLSLALLVMMSFATGCGKKINCDSENGSKAICTIDGPADTDLNPTPQPDPVRTAEPAVRNEGTLRVANAWNEAYDLDATDPEWSEDSATTWTADITKRNGSAIWLTEFSSYVSVPATTETKYAECLTSGYGGKVTSIRYDSLTVDEKFCFKTSEHRLSFVRVLRVDASKSVLDLYVTTWDVT